MKYVNMQDVAFDQVQIAFPGLGNCHGIVYMNQQGLFAYHLSGVPKANRTTAFANFVTTHPNGGGPGLGLIGFCPSNRFAKNSLHKAELKPIANALGYTGKIRGYRWNLAQLRWRTTYVEVNFNQGAIMCSIENFDDDKDTDNNPAPNDHMSVVLGSVDPPNPVNLDEVITVVVRTGVPTFVNPAVL